jgi:hypothetical protein
MNLIWLLSKSGTLAGLDLSEISLLIFGLMVAVGVLGESAKSKKWEGWIRAFELLVIFGVAGEMFADGVIFIFSKNLQTISDSELSVAITKAGDAKTSADNAADAAHRASDSARQAESLAHTAHREADSFEKEITSANKHAQAAESHIQEALTESAKAAEEARNARREQGAITTENLRLQQQINPRRLSESQKRDLMAKLTAVLPFTVQFDLPASNDTSEVFDFTDDLKDVFVRMGLLERGPTTGLERISLIPTRVRGVVLGSKSETERPQAIIVLGDALIQMGFATTWEGVPQRGLDTNTMLIAVGPKQ